MNRIVTAILIILVAALTAKPADRGGMTLIDSIAVPDEPFFGSAAFVIDTEHPWVCDLDNEYYVKVVPWNNNSDYWEPSVEYLVYKVENGVDRLVASRRVKTPGKSTALRLLSGRNELHLSAPNAPYVFEKDVSIPRLTASSQIRLYGHHRARLAKVEVRFETVSRPEHHVMDEDIESSGHDMTATGFVGIWKYLDRVTPQDGRVMLGGQYTLAIVPDEDCADRLVILYVDGDKADMTDWARGDIKGRLTATPFALNYDLEWHGADGRPLDADDNYALFEGTNLVTFYFPMLDSQIRFYKVPEE